MDKKKMYILIAVLAAILVACLILVFVLKGGNEGAKDPDTTQLTGETADNGETTPDSTDGTGTGTDGTGTDGTGTDGTGTDGTGNGGTGNGSTGNGSTGNGGTGNDGNGGTSEPTTGGSDVDISIDMEVVPNDFDTPPATEGNQVSSTPTTTPEGSDAPSNVIRFDDLLNAGKNGN